MAEISIEKLKEIASIKGFGKSTKYIQEKVDPLWGKEGDLKKYRVECQQTTIVSYLEHGSVEVFATSAEDAKIEAEQMWCSDEDFDWEQECFTEETNHEDFEIKNVEVVND